MCICGNKSCFWEGNTGDMEVREEHLWSKGFVHACADELWSSTRGFGLADFIFNSSMSALTIEILIQPGYYSSVPPVLYSAERVKDFPTRAMGEEMEPNSGCGDGNFMVALLRPPTLTDDGILVVREEGGWGGVGQAAPGKRRTCICGRIHGPGMSGMKKKKNLQVE